MTDGAQRGAGGAARGRRVTSGLRSSLLVKILAALVVALVGSSTLTALLEGRLTQSALSAQGRRVTTSHLRVLERAYGDRERQLIGDLRNLGQSISGNRLVEPERRNELISELGRAYRNLELDILQVVDGDGRALDPPAGVGDQLAGPPLVSADDRLAPASRLLATGDGRWLQAVVIPVGPGRDAPVLVGGYEYGDAFAYRLRRQLGDLGHVVLVADNRVVGSTLTSGLGAPPASGPGEALPTAPVQTSMDGTETLVAYRPVARGTGGAEGGLGVLLNDPEGSLDQSLSRAQMVAAAVLAVVALTLGWLFFRALVRPLVGLKKTAGEIAEGNLEASFAASGSDEIASLAHSLERMRLELRSQLELIAAQAADLKDSSQRIVAAQDEERHRLARDLHDGIQQQLVVLRMGFGMAKEASERLPSPVAASLEELSAELDAVIERVREVSHDLYPSILVDRGLVPALRTCLARLPLSARLECSPDPLPRLPPEIESGAYFLLGEALANALKHAAASEITVGVNVSDGWLELCVADDGRGFRADDVAMRSGGLLHMEDRARSFGGHLRISSEPGGGTEVRATLPVAATAGLARPN